MSKTSIYLLCDPTTDVSAFCSHFTEEWVSIEKFVNWHEMMALASEAPPAVLVILDAKIEAGDLSLLKNRWEQVCDKKVAIWRFLPGDDDASIDRFFSPCVVEKIFSTANSSQEFRQLLFYVWEKVPLLEEELNTNAAGGRGAFEGSTFAMEEKQSIIERQAFGDITAQMDEYERRLRNAFYCTRLELLQRQSSRSRTLENLLPTCLSTVKSVIKNETFTHQKPIDVSLILEEGLCFINDHHFERLLQELLKNAVHFANINGRIEIGWFVEGLDAKLVVYNSGNGVNSAELEELKKSFREEFPVRYNAQWGLKIVAKIARLYNATIDISSESGEYFALEIAFPNVTAQNASVRRSAVTGIPCSHSSEALDCV